MRKTGYWDILYRHTLKCDVSTNSSYVKLLKKKKKVDCFTGHLSFAYIGIGTQLATDVQAFDEHSQIFSYTIQKSVQCLTLNE